MHISIADDIDGSLRSDMKISETTGIEGDDGEVLAGATRASIADVTDDEIHFWPSYAAEADHESVDYDEIPAENSNVELEES